MKLFPLAKWHQWEPAVGDGTREGTKLAFGRYVNAVYRVSKADVIVSLDSDFLAAGPGHVRYMREFYDRRHLNGPQDEMNRLYVVEPTPSVTGATADNRLPLRAKQVGAFAKALAGKLGLGVSGAAPSGADKWLDAVAADLQKHRGSSLSLQVNNSLRKCTHWRTPSTLRWAMLERRLFIPTLSKRIRQIMLHR